RGQASLYSILLSERCHCGCIPQSLRWRVFNLRAREAQAVEGLFTIEVANGETMQADMLLSQTPDVAGSMANPHETQMRLSCTREVFLLEGRLRASEGANEVCRREWDRRNLGLRRRPQRKNRETPSSHTVRAISGFSALAPAAST